MPEDGLDQRNATLLTDEARKLFLAALQPDQGNSYAVIYKTAFSWSRYCDKMAKKKPEQAEKWLAAKERWDSSVHWADTNLILTGAVGGRRAQQIVEAITSEKGTKSGPEVMFQVSGSGNGGKEPEKKKGWLFRR